MNPHRHSNPTSPTFFLQLKHLDRFFWDGVAEVPSSPLPLAPFATIAEDDDGDERHAGVLSPPDTATSSPLEQSRTGVLPGPSKAVVADIAEDDKTEAGPPAADVLVEATPAAAPAAPADEDKEDVDCDASVPRMFELLSEYVSKELG